MGLAGVCDAAAGNEKEEEEGAHGLSCSPGRRVPFPALGRRGMAGGDGSSSSMLGADEGKGFLRPWANESLSP